MADETNDLITLVDEEGHEHQFSLYDVLEMEEKRYALLIPIGENGEEDEEEGIVFRVEKDEQGDDILVNIEDDEEFERVCAAFDEFDEAGDEEEDEE